MIEAEELVLPEADGTELPALLVAPADAIALLCLAHGAGAGMRHDFMERFGQALAEVGVASFRWEFPYMAAGRRRPDRAPVAVAAVRRAVARAAEIRDERWPDLPLLAGGKSFGGRMTSTAAAERPLGGVAGLVFVGFPLHPARKPGVDRAAHLADVSIPMLFLQGTRDALAGLDLLRPVLDDLGSSVTLHLEEDADHGFHVRKRSGRDDDAVRASMAEAVHRWLESV
ncbi:MAG: alpha/beta hydrolase [Gemmatimonadetes bacterium]|nr:alpha/beta hydrolase [Gemmatimonadota bacterium]